MTAERTAKITRISAVGMLIELITVTCTNKEKNELE